MTADNHELSKDKVDHLRKKVTEEINHSWINYIAPVWPCSDDMYQTIEADFEDELSTEIKPSDSSYLHEKRRYINIIHYKHTIEGTKNDIIYLQLNFATNNICEEAEQLLTSMLKNADDGYLGEHKTKHSVLTIREVMHAHDVLTEKIGKLCNFSHASKI